MTPETLGERVKARRTKIGLSQARLAEAVTVRGIKLSQQNVNSIESGVVARPRALPEIASELKTTIEWLRDGEGPEDVQPVMSIEPQPDILGATPITRMPLASGAPDVPVWASVQAGDDGAMILTSEPIDYIRRSDRMMNVRNPFAFYVIGTSMSPVIEQGDQVVINPTIIAQSGSDCVFIHEQADGTMLAVVKRLVRVTPDQWKVRQYNPPKDYDLPKKKWSKALFVAEKRYRGG